MKVCIQGLWHLGCVTAGCMVSLGNEIIGFDENSSLINDLQNGKINTVAFCICKKTAQDMAKGLNLYDGLKEEL